MAEALSSAPAQSPQQPPAPHSPPTTDIKDTRQTDVKDLPPTEIKDLNPVARPRRPPRPNYAQIHSHPLPLPTSPLPAFIPHNPLSLFRFLSALLSPYLSPLPRPSPHTAYFSPATRAVHVTDALAIRALWEAGFFGKGSLSRSEPSWAAREDARRAAAAGAGGTSEEATRKRREERRMFKLERARAEREAVEAQLRREGKLEDGEGVVGGVDGDAVGLGTEGGGEAERTRDVEDDAPRVDQEHLQLTMHEAFFLAYALGALTVQAAPTDPTALDAAALLPLFASHAAFRPTPAASVRPDNAFLVSYAVYHHFRSLGWVVRPGSKFAVDWLLYNRGPVFSHAEFAVVVVPEYPAGWGDRWGDEGRRRRWWEVHCTNRVQSQVRKTLVLAYVEVPLEVDVNGGHVGAVLGSYRVREFVVRRFLANRSRD